jgi:hypothetical protein
MTVVLMANIAAGSAAIGSSPPGTFSVVVATSAPTGDPCGSQHRTFHDHALCCASVSCAAFVPVDVMLAIVPDVRSPAITGGDLNFRSHAPPALFHPPKLLIIA